MDGQISGTGASTRTRTITMVRMAAIKLQVTKFLAKALGDDFPDAETMDRIGRGIDERWIARVAVQAVDAEERMWAEFALIIDWNTYQLHVDEGRTTVDIDGRWPDQTAFDILALAKVFNDYVSANGFGRHLAFRYRRGLDTKLINRRLGFKKATTRIWISRPDETLAQQIEEIDEVTVQIRVVEPK